MQGIETLEDAHVPLINAFRKDFPKYLSYFSFNQGLERGYVLGSITESIDIFPLTKPQKNLYSPYLNSMGIFRRRIMDERNIDIDAGRLDRLCEIYFEMVNGTTRAEAYNASKLLPKLEKELYGDVPIYLDSVISEEG